MAREASEKRSLLTNEKIPDWLDLANQDTSAVTASALIVREEDNGSWSIVRTVEGSEAETDRGYPTKELAVRTAQLGNEGSSLVIEERVSKQIKEASIHAGMIAKYGENDVTITEVDGNDLRILTPTGQSFYVDYTQLANIKEAQGEYDAVEGLQAGKEEKKAYSVLDIDTEVDAIEQDLEEFEEELEDLAEGPPVSTSVVKSYPGEVLHPKTAIHLAQEVSEQVETTSPKDIKAILQQIGIPVRASKDGRLWVKKADRLVCSDNVDRVTGEVNKVYQVLDDRGIALTGIMARDEAVKELVKMGIEAETASRYVQQADYPPGNSVEIPKPVKDETPPAFTPAEDFRLNPTQVESFSPAIAEAMKKSNIVGIKTAALIKILKEAAVEVTAKEPPTCKKCGKPHWPFQKCPTGKEPPKKEGPKEEVTKSWEIPEKEALKKVQAALTKRGVTLEEFFATKDRGTALKMLLESGFDTSEADELLDRMDFEEERSSLEERLKFEEEGPEVIEEEFETEEPEGEGKFTEIEWTSTMPDEDIEIKRAKKLTVAQVAKISPAIAGTMQRRGIKSITGNALYSILKEAQDEMECGPMCSKCGKEPCECKKEEMEEEKCGPESMKAGDDIFEYVAGDRKVVKTPAGRWVYEDTGEEAPPPPEEETTTFPEETPILAKKKVCKDCGKEKCECKKKEAGKVRMTFDWGEFFNDVLPQLSNKDFQKTYESSLDSPPTITASQDEHDLYKEELGLFAKEAQRRKLPLPEELEYGIGDRVAIASDPKVSGTVTEYKDKRDTSYLVDIPTTRSQLWFKGAELKPRVAASYHSEEPIFGRTHNVTEPANSKQQKEFQQEQSQKTGATEESEEDTEAEPQSVEGESPPTVEDVVREAINYVVDEDTFYNYLDENPDATATDFVASFSGPVMETIDVAYPQLAENEQLQASAESQVPEVLASLFPNPINEVTASIIKDAVIRKCKPSDRDPDRPTNEQQWCLYSKSTGKVLGRHPSKEKAFNQEKAIRAQGAVKEGKWPEDMIKTRYMQRQRGEEAEESLESVQEKLQAKIPEYTAFRDKVKEALDEIRELRLNHSDESPEVLEKLRELQDLNKVFTEHRRELAELVARGGEAKRSLEPSEAMLKQADSYSWQAAVNGISSQTAARLLQALEEGTTSNWEQQVLNGFEQYAGYSQDEIHNYLEEKVGPLKEMAIGEPPGTSVEPTPEAPAFSAPPGAPSAKFEKVPPAPPPIPSKTFMCPMDGEEFTEQQVGPDRQCPKHSGVKVIEKKAPKAPAPKAVPPLPAPSEMPIEAKTKKAVLGDSTVYPFVDTLLSKVQKGNISLTDATKELTDEVWIQGWDKDDIGYAKDVLHGKVAKQAIKGKELVLCFHNDHYKLYDPDFGPVSVDDAGEKDIKQQLQAFGVADKSITDALKAAKNDEVIVRVAKGQPAVLIIKIDKEADDAADSAIVAHGPQATMAQLMMFAMDSFAKSVGSDEAARVFKDKIKEKVRSKIEPYPRETYNGNREFPQSGVTGSKEARVYTPSERSERIEMFKKHGIPLVDEIEQKASPWRKEDDRCLSAIGLKIGDKVRDTSFPEFTGTVIEVEGENLIRVAMDKSNFCPDGGEGLYLSEGLINLSEADEEFSIW